MRNLISMCEGGKNNLIVCPFIFFWLLSADSHPAYGGMRSYDMYAVQYQLLLPLWRALQTPKVWIYHWRKDTYVLQCFFHHLLDADSWFLIPLIWIPAPRFFGDHTSNLSVFGCKYRYLPDKPHLRRFIRGSVCGKCDNSAFLLKHSIFLIYVDWNVAQSDKQLHITSLELLLKYCMLKNEHNSRLKLTLMISRFIAAFSCNRERQAASH